MVSEKYTVSTDLVIFKETNREIKPKKDISNSKVKIPNIGTMRRRSYELDLATYQSDLDSLTRINEALDQCTYALKSPVKRIYSYGNPQHGGRLYTRLQGLPDRRARIRINTLLNGEPVAEVDLSANHPRMLMALANKDLSPTFYADIAQATNTTREQVKFLIVKAIGASNRKISLKTIGKETDLSSKAVLTSIERARIERHLETAYPEIFYSLYKGIGTLLQALEGDLLLKAMLDLLDLGIVSLPMHDAIYVQKRYMKHAQVSLENAWMETLGVSFRPYTKIDTYRSSE
jgi:hypothetical protein